MITVRACGVTRLLLQTSWVTCVMTLSPGVWAHEERGLSSDYAADEAVAGR